MLLTKFSRKKAIMGDKSKPIAGKSFLMGAKSGSVILTRK